MSQACTSCRFENPAGAKFCQECGGRLELLCSACGTQLPPAAKFCHECGGAQVAGAAASGGRPGTTPVAAPARSTSESYAGGRYEVQRLLGEGARKRVHLARDTQLGRDVALSLIKSDGLDDAGRARVRHEAQAMARLGDHAHIVTVHDIGEEAGRLYMVSEFMGGGDLETHLKAAKDGRLAVEESLRIVSEVCAALEHAHGQGIIHRDVKPGNIWLKQDGSTALGDFGLAFSEDRTRITSEGMMVGTVAYMPPEQALGRPTDARSDLYALGVTLYELLTGRTPFAGDDAVAIISQHINTPPVAPSWHNSEVPKPLDELVLRLLAKSPEQRPANAGEARSALGLVADASVVSPVPETATNPLDALAAGVFVGRDEEVAKLRNAADSALSGKGRVALLVGEPGIGKTRTTEELGTYASMRGAQVLWGRCYEGEGAPTYWPWVQIVRAYAQEADPAALLGEMGAGASAIADVVSEVKQRIPGLQPAAELSPEETRFRLFDSITSFLRNAARQRPLVLVLDDLHWADKPSLLLLQFLARELAGARILVVGTYRDVELGRKHPLAEALGELSRGEATDRVLLRGLAQQDVARFVELSIGRPPPAALAQAVFRETEGNPFFVHEVVRLLAADGRLDDTKQSGTWSVEIPQGIREAVGRRLNRLSDGCNELLAVAAVVGREFELRVLERAAENSREQIIEHLEEALASRLIQEFGDGPDQYRFSHALVRETLYEELSTTRRVRLHRSIGETLESLHAGNDARLASLAYHFGEGAHGGGDVQKAVDFSRRAGDRAVALCAHEDAAPHYERAVQLLELLEKPRPEERCDLLLALGRAHSEAGDNELARPVIQKAIDIARKISDAKRLARGAAVLAGSSHTLGVIQAPIVEVCEEALEALGGEDCPELAQVLTELGMEIWLGETHERAKQLMLQAVAVARRVGDVPALIEALFILNITLTSSPKLDERRRLVTEVFELAEQIDNPELLTQAYFSRFYLRFVSEDLAGAWLDHEAVEPLLQRTQSGRSEFFFRLQAATQAIVDGRLEEAEKLASEAFRFGVRLGGDIGLQMYGAQLSVLRYFQGRLEELAITLGASRHPQPVWRTGVAWIYAELGNEKECRQWYEPLAANDFAEVPRDTNWPAALSLLSGAAAFLRDRKNAEYLYEQMLPWKDQQIQVGAAAYGNGPGAAHLARLARSLGRLDEAVELFDDSLKRTRKMGFRPWLAIFSLEQARTLLERNGAGDDERALRLLSEAVELAREIGMPKIVEDALALRLEVQGIDASLTQHSIYAVARSIQDRRPDFGALTAADGTVTLVFSDIESFTQMTERLGDSEAHRVVQNHHAIVREKIRAHGGHEVELRGDGFLLAFQDPARALRCCIDMQRAFAEYNGRNPDEPIRIRLGLHTGEAIRDADKFFGKTVIQAFRIADLADGDQILVSEDLKRQVEGDAQLRFDAGREHELKGISGRHRLYGVDWS